MKLVGIFILLMVCNFFLFISLGAFFSSDLPYESAIYTMGSMIVILLTVVLSVLVYLISSLKNMSNQKTY